MVGVLFGASCSLLIKHSDLSRFPIKETGLILLFGYASYLFAELFHLSGKI
jgi:sodium/hydrogen exchanger-like protein 6/7